MLIPSTCTALLTRAYTSTLYTSLVSHKTQFLCFVLALKVWWSTFRPPQTAAHAALCGLLLLRRSLKELTEVKTGIGCDKMTFFCTNKLGLGLFEEKYLGVGMMIKDRKRFPSEPGNWGYFAFFCKDLEFTPTANKLPLDRCGACHVKLASDTDYVITDAHLGLAKAGGH
jgi:hypothetical protein